MSTNVTIHTRGEEPDTVMSSARVKLDESDGIKYVSVDLTANATMFFEDSRQAVAALQRAINLIRAGGSR